MTSASRRSTLVVKPLQEMAWWLSVVGGVGSVTRYSSRCRIPNAVKHSEQPECFRYGESSNFYAKVDIFTSE